MRDRVFELAISFFPAYFVFAFALQYSTHTLSKDVALSLIVFAHFQKIISSTASNISTRQQNCCKAKHESPSAFTIITTSYVSQCLGQHCLFQGGERGIMDEDNLLCFLELNKSI